MLKRLLLLALCGILLLSFAACGEETDEEDVQQNATEETYPQTYVPNETINRFLVTLKSRLGYQSLNIEKGNAPDEYRLFLNGCYVSLSPSAYGIGAVITAEKGEESQERLMAVFRHLTRAADKSCTPAQLDEAIARMKASPAACANLRVCNEVKILNYQPSVQVGGSATDHRLDLLLMNYIQVETEE